ncbi:MAG TPA: hypothetical protein VIR98_01930 [Candidatus Paceibacterota bacterium]|jgi:hypothetical protein
MTSFFRKVLAMTGAVAMTFASYAPVLSPVAHANAASWKQGVSIVPRWAEDFASDSFKEAVRAAQSDGVDYIALIIPYLQSDYGSSSIGPRWDTPSDATLNSAIDFIHGLGMKVVLKPHLEVGNGGWRALIDAHDRDTWYANYSTMLNHLGDIGAQKNVEMIVAGTELVSMASPYMNPDNTQRWQTMISSLRSHYPGLVTYSANWGQGNVWTNEFEQLGFWSSLDFIGISAYFELSPNNGSTQSIIDAWRSVDQNQIDPLRNRIGKPVIFTEVGYRSVDSGHAHPWDHEMGGGYNADEQKNAYEALFRYWNERSYFAGVMLWDWKSDPSYGGAGNTDYTPKGKPAEDVMKTWFGASGSTPTPDPDPTPTPVPEPSGDWSASAGTPVDARPGQATTIPVTLSITGSAQDVIADIEIYDAQTSKVLQKFREHQNISQSSPGNYSISWTPASTGTYTLKVGVFKSDWSKNYYWNDSTAQIAVSDQSTPPPQPDPDPTPTPTPVPTATYTTDVWWPTDGVTVSGSQPFKAMVKDKAVTDYTMFWTVDGGPLNLMSNSFTDYPHKETQVNVSNWPTKDGSYALTFISKDNTGSVISQKTVNVSVAR